MNRLTLVILWYILLVASPAQAQATWPARIDPPKVQPGNHRPPSEPLDFPLRDTPLTDAERDKLYEEELELYEREKRRICLYWARRYGYHHFRMNLKLDCRFELDWKPER